MACFTTRSPASSLIKINLAGETVLQPDHDYSVNAAGYVIHSAVHTARHDAECVIHTHTRAGTAVSALADGLMPLSQTAMRFSGHLAYHEYEGPAFNRGERERLVADLGNKNAMILRNHGLLVCAPSIPQAFNLIYWLEQAAKSRSTFCPAAAAARTSHKSWWRLTADASRGRRSHSRTRTPPILT
jgi:ribulose-5-phosphate 4-epimerase/fuculose-1-phosphate aldolase